MRDRVSAWISAHPEAVSVGKGALVAAAGAGLTYLTVALGGHDWGVWTPAVTAALAVLVNAARKALAGEARL